MGLTIGVIVYFFIAFCIFLWDGYFGFGEEFDNDKDGLIYLVCLFWPLSILIFLFNLIHHLMNKKKAQRIAVRKKLNQIRIDTEKEKAQILKEIETEIEKL